MLGIGLIGCGAVSAAMFVPGLDDETKIMLFGALGTIVLMTVFSAISKIPQDMEYHNFADQRHLCGVVPNYMDVLSNAPFFFVGALGLAALRPDTYPASEILQVWEAIPNVPSFRNLNIKTEEEREAWVVFFVGVLFVSFGSGYYHWYRTSKTLVWDRLPMTIAFMSTFALQCMERLGQKAACVLYPAILIGAASVFLWDRTDDLRLYAVVQFFPLVSMPLLIAGFDPQYTRSDLLLVALGFYVLCKIVELYDRQIFALTRGIISGHTLKHLAAAVSPFVALYYLSVRASL